MFILLRNLGNIKNIKHKRISIFFKVRQIYLPGLVSIHKDPLAFLLIPKYSLDSQIKSFPEKAKTVIKLNPCIFCSKQRSRGKAERPKRKHWNWQNQNKLVHEEPIQFVCSCTSSSFFANQINSWVSSWIYVRIARFNLIWNLKSQRMLEQIVAECILAGFLCL